MRIAEQLGLNCLVRQTFELIAERAAAARHPT